LPGGVSTKWGVSFSESRAAREVLELAPQESAAMKLSMLWTLADGFGFAFFLGCQPAASDARSIARFAGTEVREPSRFERRMESL
jgi:hypothetical protein